MEFFMIKKFYDKIKGNYEEAITRMRDDERIKKYLKFFLMDESFAQLKSSINSNSCEEAFKAAHTLKGVSQNMSFTDLSNSVIEITELLRAGNLADSKKIFPVVEEKYELVINEINKII